MTVIIDGTNGVQSVGGSATITSFTAIGDTNTGIFFPAADTIAFAEGGVESARFNSSGDFGVGETSPDSRLEVAKAITFANIDTFPQLCIKPATGSTGNRLNIAVDNSSNIAFIQAVNRGVGDIPLVLQRYGGNVGIGTTSPLDRLDVASGGTNFRARVRNTTGSEAIILFQNSDTGTNLTDGLFVGIGADETGYLYHFENQPLVFGTNNTERARITSGGAFLVGKTSASFGGTEGFFVANGDSSDVGYAAQGYLTRVSQLNRQGDDGNLVEFFQDSNLEGTISVSGTTVSYNGGHLSRWSQTTDNTRIPLLKGTVMSNLDQMAVWEKDGKPLPNEQLNCMKVSDVEGDVNVAGVFVNWDNDDDEFANDMNVAMTGDMIIRIAQGVVVQRGDLLMSAGDGTAKPQGDDIIRSKTVAKVTSNHVTCTYEDGSYCVPCVLMAC